MTVEMSVNLTHNQATEMVPFMLADGTVEYMPLARDDLPTYLVVARDPALMDIAADDENRDRAYLGAVSVDEAIGMFLRANPRMTYADILDHMEA